MNPLQVVLLLASFWYLVPGGLYSYLSNGDVMLTPVMSMLAFSGVISGLLVTRKEAVQRNNAPSSMDQTDALIISFVAFAFILLVMAAYLLIDGQYFSYDKIERAEIISRMFYMRFVVFTSCALLGVLIIRWSRCAKQVKAIVLITYLLIFLYALIELNRELFLILGLSYYLYYIFNVGPISPARLFAVSVIAVLFMLLFKYWAYWAFFGKSYEGGVLSIGELVNWSRWTDMALLNGWDLRRVQAQDISYFLSALVYPFSSHDTSSEVLFRGILGQSGLGQLFGYSGPLWAYGYLGYAGIFLFYFLLAATLSYLDLGKSRYLDILAISMMFITFRFFRQEWVVPAKTLLWVYVYPAIIVLLASNLRVRR